MGQPRVGVTHKLPKASAGNPSSEKITQLSQVLLQQNLHYLNINYPNFQLSKRQIECSIRVFYQQVYALLE